MTVVAQIAHVSKPLLVMAKAKTTVSGIRWCRARTRSGACEGGGVT